MSTQILTHDDLIARGKKWLSSAHKGIRSMGVILTEIHTGAPCIPDVIGFNSYQSVVIECKISRSDFLNDFKKSHRHHVNQLGNYRYYLTVPNVANENDLPEGWGLLYCQSSHIDIIKSSQLFTDGVREAEYSLLYSLCRRAEIRNLIPQLLEKPESYYPL